MPSDVHNDIPHSEFGPAHNFCKRLLGILDKKFIKKIVERKRAICDSKKIAKKDCRAHNEKSIRFFEFPADFRKAIAKI